MKADPAHQVKLLELQELDSRAAQLRHQRGHLRELTEIAALEAERRTLTDQERDARIVVDDLAAEQQKADAEVETVTARRERDRARIDAGLITNPKDLERMQHEMVSLERRISTLEDAELDVMEKLEEAQQVLDGLAIRLADVDARLEELVAARDARFAEIDADLASVQAQRGPALEGMPEDLLKLYERLREAKSGVAVSLLRARQCGGCQLTLDASEISRIRTSAPDEVIRCEECQRILVRTSESGL